MNNFRRRAESGLTFNADHETVINGITFVDLGLPSGILWAKSNLYTEYKTFAESQAYGSGKIKCPSKANFEELLENVAYNQYSTTTYQSRTARRMTGRNTAAIYFVSGGYKHNTATQATDYGNPYAWTTTITGTGNSEAYVMTRGGVDRVQVSQGVYRLYLTDYMSTRYLMSIWPIYVP